MDDGGFCPAYNVQFATDGKTRMIVSVDVGNNGSDGGQMAPLHFPTGLYLTQQGVSAV